MEIKEQEEILRRTGILSRRGVLGINDAKLEVGDIVYDEKNKEYGILLGVRPDITNKDAIKSFLNKTSLKTSPEIQNCIIMTISKDGDRSDYLARIRYTRSDLLRLIEERHENIPRDVDRHCQGECFMDCSQECSLWRYRTSKKP